MSWSRSKVWRRIEDAMTGNLGDRDRKALFEEVESNPQARADYDIAFEALRELEQAPVAQAELDVVESWLMDDLAGQTEAAVAWWRRPWMAGVLALAAAAALVVAINPSTTTEVEDDGFAARGAGDDRGLAIDVLCPQKAGVASRRGLVPAAEYGCGLDGTLSFAYRVDPSAEGGTLSLFGVDAAGDVLYYGAYARFGERRGCIAGHVDAASDGRATRRESRGGFARRLWPRLAAGSHRGSDRRDGRCAGRARPRPHR